MKMIIGKKVGMSRIFDHQGQIIPVTVVHVAPNIVIDIKTKEKNGYDAIVVGYETIKQKRLSKPVQGQFDKQKLDYTRHLIELRDLTGYKIGDLLTVKQQFKIGDLIDVQGTSRGHGFTGAIKLWNFSCGPRSHGAGWPHRFQGSIETGRGGSSAQRVFKGKKMSGRYGHDTVSMINLEIVGILSEENLVLIKGSIPGRRHYLVRLKTTTRAKKSVATPFKILLPIDTNVEKESK